MIIKRFLALFALSAVMAAPVMAAPSVSVDLRRKANGTPELNAAGNFEYIVRFVPDQTWFTTPASGSNAGKLGGSMALDAGFTLSKSANDATSTYTGAWVLGATKGAASTGTDTDAVGTAPAGFGWVTTGQGEGGTYSSGLQVEAGATADQVYAALGSLYLTAAAAGAGQVQLDAQGRAVSFVIEAPGPSTQTGASVLSTRLVASGAYGGNGRVAQNDPNSLVDVFDTLNTTVQFRTRGGDISLDGIVGSADLSIFSGNYNTSGKQWQQGDFNNDGLVNSADLSVLSTNYNQSAPAPFMATGSASVPEPSTIAIVALAGLGVAAARFRRR